MIYFCKILQSLVVLIDLVTGGSGFIGSFIIEELLKTNNQVICIDDFSTGNFSNIEKQTKNKNFKLINQNITKPIDIAVDRIWHFASPASPSHYKYNPIKTTSTNFLGTYNMLKLATQYKARILMASSSEIYGDPTIHPQCESYYGNVNPVGERSCYVEGKRVAESLCVDFHRMHKTDIRIARIFNTYGPRMMQNDGRVISNLIFQALLNKQLTVYGKGLQTRSFCFIDDLIIGLLKLMDSDYKAPINLGSQEEISIIELAKLIKKKVNREIKITYKHLPKDDPMKRKPDLELAKSKLNWEPKLSLSKGLDYTIKYFKDYLNT